MNADIITLDSINGLVFSGASRIILMEKKERLQLSHAKYKNSSFVASVYEQHKICKSGRLLLCKDSD